MIPLVPPLRLARVEDAPVLARLATYASEGLTLHIWRGKARSGEDPWEIGERRQLELMTQGTIVVVDEDAGPVAELTGYPVTEPKPLDDVPALFRPVKELENRALDSWYINVLSALPEARGRGLGTRLLRVAEEIARDLELGRLSLIVADNNKGARRLYERQGFVEAERRPMIKEGWKSEGTEWILMIKAV